MFLLRWAFKVVTVIMALILLYLSFNFVQVWRAAGRDEAQPSDAIVVFGAAQYDGTPSPVLAARLDHAIALYQTDVAKVIVVTGGRAPGDRTTEASASAQYLIDRGIPDSAIRREVAGRSSWQSLASTANFLKKEGRTEVVLVSDPFHSARIDAMAGELGLRSHVSPTRHSPIDGLEEVGHMGRETIAVSVGKIIGFRRLVGIERVRNEVQSR